MSALLGAHLSAVDGEDFGAEIKRRRERLGMDQADLAREAHVGRTTVHKIEKGESSRPSTRSKLLRTLEAVEIEAGVDVTPSEVPDVEQIEFEVEGVTGVKVVRARGPKGDHEMLRDDIIAIIRGIQGNPASEPAKEED